MTGVQTCALPILRGDGAWCLSAKDSKVKIFVIPTDEEFMIASDVERIVNGK